MSGYPDGTYKPENVLNRAELLKIVVEAVYEDEFEPYANSNCFDDVPVGEWYTQYVCFAKDMGIVVGYSGNEFKPETSINFVEALKISMEVFDYNYEESDPWYKGFVDEAAERNFIPLEFASFDQYMNRGQMADMITRILKFQAAELDDYLGKFMDFKVTYDSLAGGVDVEPVTCRTEGSVDLLVGQSYTPWASCNTCTCEEEGGFSCTEVNCDADCMYGFDYYYAGDIFDSIDGCNTCTCEEDGSVSCTEIYCEEDLLTKVCGEGEEIHDWLDCTEEKIEEYGCEWANEISYYEFDFVQCNMTEVYGDEEALVHVGGMLANAYNLVGEDEDGEAVMIADVIDLFLYWGEVDSKENALGFAKAATGDRAYYSLDEMEEAFGEDFYLTVDESEVAYSDVYEVQDAAIPTYQISLYYEPIFGCTPFPVYEYTYEVSSEEFTLHGYDEIGEIDSGMCVD